MEWGKTDPRQFAKGLAFYHEFKVTANLIINNVLLQLFMEWGKVDPNRFAEGFAFYKEIKAKADIITINTLLKFYLEWGKADPSRFAKGLQFYDEIKTKADIVTDSTMLQLYVEWGKVEPKQFTKGLAFYKEVESRTDIVTHNTLLKLYLEWGKVEPKQFTKGLAFYKKIKSRADRATNNTMLQLYVEWGKVEPNRFAEGLTFYNEIQTKADVIINSILLKLYLEWGKVEPNRFAEGLTFYNEIQTKADVIINSILLKLYLEWGKVDPSQFAKGLFLYEEIKAKADIVTATTMLQLYLEWGKVDPSQFAKGLAFYNEIKAKANIVTNDIMLQSYLEWSKVDPSRFAEGLAFYNQIKVEANTITISTMLRMYVEWGKIDRSQFAKGLVFYHENQAKADIVTATTMLQLYLEWGKVDPSQFEEGLTFYHQIKEKANIITCNTMLQLFLEWSKGDPSQFEEGLIFYDKIKTKADAITHTILLNLYIEWGKIDPKQFEAAEKFYKTNLLHKNLMNKNVAFITTIIKLYLTWSKVNIAKLREGIEFLKSLPETDIHYSSLYACKLVLKKFNVANLSFIKSLLDKANTQLPPPTAANYRRKLIKLCYYYHQLREALAARVQSKPELQIELSQVDEKIKSLLITSQNGSAVEDISLLQAYLFQLYLPEENFTPPHQAMDAADISHLQQSIWEKLNHPSRPFAAKDQALIKIDVVNRYGKKIRTEIINDSIYHRLGLDRYGPPLMVDFDGPIKPSRLPLFIRYDDKIYRTDIIGGSRLKAKQGSGQYGGMIAVPIELGEYFKAAITYDEGFAYGQRAFFPEDLSQQNKGLSGQFKVGVIPDGDNYVVKHPFIIKDGWGYIKRSVADKMGLRHRTIDTPRTSYLSYQATQCYSACGERAVVEEMVNIAKPTIAKLKQKLQTNQTIDKPELNKIYSSFSNGIPNHMATAIPVIGDKLVFPPLAVWQSLKVNGVIVGRNPYDSKKLLVVEAEKIAYLDFLARLQSVQYSLTGLIQKLTGEFIPRFFKGMLGVIDDKDWPEELVDCELLVSSKDQKLSGDWQVASDKEQAQKAREITRYVLHGCLAVKQVLACGELVGMTPKIMELLAGDFDGDDANFVNGEGLDHTKAMITRETEEYMVNAKMDKTVTLRTQVGNFFKMMELRMPVLEKWISVCIVFYTLSPEEKQSFAQEIVKNHILRNTLGENWEKKLGISPEKINPLSMMIAEIQVGIKCGTDAMKTKIPAELLLQRAKKYSQALRQYNPDLSVAYAKSLRRKIEAMIANNEVTYENLSNLLLNSLMPDKSYNLTAKPQRALVRYFLDKTPHDNMALYISDDETTMTKPPAVIAALQKRNESKTQNRNKRKAVSDLQLRYPMDVPAANKIPKFYESASFYSYFMQQIDQPQRKCRFK